MGTDALHRSACNTLGRLTRARADDDVFGWEDSPGRAPQLRAAAPPHAAVTTALLAGYRSQSPGFVGRVGYLNPAVPLFWRQRLARV